MRHSTSARSWYEKFQQQKYGMKTSALTYQKTELPLPTTCYVMCAPFLSAHLIDPSEADFCILRGPEEL
jgi:hypothetical protein